MERNVPALSARPLRSPESQANVDPSAGFRQAAREIMQYLIQHPDAKDTLDGIRNWWLRQPEQWSENELRDAVALLVGKEWMRAWETKPGVRVYGLGKFPPSELRDRLPELAAAPRETPPEVREPRR